MGHFPHTPAVPFDDIPGRLPGTFVPKDVNMADTQKLALKLLNDLEASDLADDCIWRDLLSFSGTFRTFQSKEIVHPTLQLLRTRMQSEHFVADSRPPRLSRLGCIDVDLTFSVRHGNLTGIGAGIVSMIPGPDGRWLIWMLRTWLENFKDHGHPDLLEAPQHPNTDQEAIYDAVVVGAGQAGLSVAGRMKALGLKYLVLERNEQVGDVWRNRYESLKWHTGKEYGNLPFDRTYAPDDEKMLPAGLVGAGHQKWAEKHKINVRTSAAVERAEYDSKAEVWTIAVASEGVPKTILSRNLVLAIGPGHATPVSPPWASPEKVEASGFQGTIIHSSKYRSAKAFAGKRGIVIGTANTAHDVAEDMANANMQTTMVQRGKTFVAPVEWISAAQDVHYNTEIPTAWADRVSFTFPYKIMREMTNQAVHAAVKANAERFDALENAGFKVDRLGDIYTYLYVRYGGHYIDVGASRRIAAGEIKMTGKSVKELSQSGLVFEDGTEMPADLIVLCTGFEHDFRADAAKLIGQDAADQMDDYWGMDAEGEIRGLAKKGRHPHIYYLGGGDIRVSRWYSRFVALQIQAEIVGCGLEIYDGGRRDVRSSCGDKKL